MMDIFCNRLHTLKKDIADMISSLPDFYVPENIQDEMDTPSTTVYTSEGVKYA